MAYDQIDRAAVAMLLKLGITSVVLLAFCALMLAAVLWRLW